MKVFNVIDSCDECECDSADIKTGAFRLAALLKIAVNLRQISTV